ncbi:MAG TPA: hypothetical protein VGQ40_01805 [Chthoniobacterales bacterium]|nr:hypothetical protein [Chthoniobacterales bacterium]
MEKSAPLTSRAPGSGLKLMLAIVVVFALLAGYGQWKRGQQSKVITATIIPAPNESSMPSPREHYKTNSPPTAPTTPGRVVAPGISKAKMEPIGTPAPEPVTPPQQPP